MTGPAQQPQRGFTRFNDLEKPLYINSQNSRQRGCVTSQKLLIITALKISLVI